MEVQKGTLENTLGSRYSPPHHYCVAAPQFPLGNEGQSGSQYNRQTLSLPVGLVAQGAQNGLLEVLTSNSMKTVFASLPLRIKTSKLAEPNVVGTRSKSFVSGHSSLNNGHPKISDPT